MPSNRFKHALDQTALRASGLARGASSALTRGIDHLLDRRVRLGITGFSGSGKTTLITSLIHQLRHYPDAALTALPPALQQRLLGVEVAPLGSLPLFPWRSGAEALDQEAWPNATRQESGCELEIRYHPRKRLIPGGKPGTGRIHLEIHDYPGEWLLDLPLLGMSFQQWCQQSRVQYAAHLSDPFVERISGQDPLETADDSTLQSLWRQQADCLNRLQHQGIPLLQPGRLLHATPGNLATIMPFVPLPRLVEYSEERLKNAPENTLHKRCEQHYRHYQDDWVKPFFRDVFQRIDRQLVLIDLLGSLNRGKTAFDSLRTALSHVLQSYSYGTNGLIRRLVQPRVERVVFSASKIDQVLPEQHERVRTLMASLVKESSRIALFNEVDIRCEAVAAVRSTTYDNYQGKAVLKGNTIEGPGLLSHPLLPETFPGDDYWQECLSWKLRKLLPPAGLDLQNGGPLPHIRLDSVLNDLLGDKFL